MKQNYDPKKGFKNINELYNGIGSNHVRVNSVKIIRNQVPYRKNDIEEINDEYQEVKVNSIIVNRVPIGEACSPYEVIRVQTENGLFPIVIIYYTGSDVSLCNYEIGPIVSDAKRGNKKVTFSTTNNIQAKMRQVYRLALNDGWPMEAIMIPNMKLPLQAQVIPQAWQDLNGTWADQDTYGITTQILQGADQAIMFPHAVKDKTGSLHQIGQARLMQSEITGKYIIFGSSNKHTSHSRKKRYMDSKQPSS